MTVTLFTDGGSLSNKSLHKPKISGNHKVVVGTDAADTVVLDIRTLMRQGLNFGATAFLNAGASVTCALSGTSDDPAYAADKNNVASVNWQTLASLTSSSRAFAFNGQPYQVVKMVFSGPGQVVFTSL